MSLPVKQHIVPITYLKQFSFDNKDISLYQTDINEFRKQSIRKVPIVKNIYTFIDEQNNNEKLFDLEYFWSHDIEPLYTPFIEKVRTKKNFSYEEKRHYAMFISAQKLRTLKMKGEIFKEIEAFFRDNIEGKWVKESSFDLLSKEFFEGVDEISFEEFKEKSSNNFKDIPLEMANNCFIMVLINIFLKLGEELSDMNWTFLFAPEKRCFLTSDSPVLLEEDIDSPHFPFRGGIFPLTHNIALNINSESEGFRGIGASEIRRINQLIISNADRYIFSYNEHFLRNVIKKYK